MGRSKGGFAALVALIATALLAPAAAHATPPTITDAKESMVSPGFLIAHWTLSAGMQSYYVDVATSPRANSIGGFTLGVLMDFLAPGDTGWGASAALPPGTYYLHVAALDPAKCNDPNNPECGVEEFSETTEVTIAGTPTPPPHPPTLGNVTQDNGHMSADWTLAPGEKSDFIEVATDPATYPGGDFREANTVLFEFLGFTDTSFLSTQRLPAGTYYVHVAGTDDGNCQSGSDPGCLIDEYSETKQVTIPDTGPPPSPSLDAVGNAGRRLTAAWTLPDALENNFIEAATDPALDPDGAFLIGNTVLIDVTIDPKQTAYQSEEELPPGTYYVHVATFDPACFICPDIFSNVRTVTIPPDPVIGGGGSSGGGVSQQGKAAPVPVDKSIAFRVLATAAKQDVDKLFVVAALAEAGTISVSGTVNVPNLARVYKLKAATAKATPNVTVVLKPKLPKKGLKAVKKALKRHKKVKAKLKITARDKAGNTKTETRTVTLKP